MIELVKDLSFTGKRYRATVRLGRKDIAVEHKPVRGESMNDIHKAMIATAKDKIVKDACK